MQISNLFGEEIFICKDKAEAGEIWRTRPDDRHKIWLESEVQAALICDTAEVRRIADMKKKQPGYTYKG